MAGSVKVGADTLGCVGVNSEGVAAAALAYDAQAVKASVLVQIVDGKRRDFRAAEADLQAHRQDRAVPEAFNRVVRRRV
jgi:hypothetical protein